MNLIPKINGKIYTSGGTLKVKLPLTYEGDCPFADQFELIRAEETACLTFLKDDTLPAEGYRIYIDPQGIAIASAGDAGQYYGLVTLMSLIRETKGELSCGSIEDAPRCEWRGMMLDTGRHFFGVSEVKKLLDRMAALKMNRFHWHLSEDQGYRIESKRFPKLNEIGSWRKGMPELEKDSPYLSEDGTRYGGYYTQEEIREVVAYAAKRQIMVIPEIDLPGHTSAIVAAYPELSCSGEPCEVKAAGGIFPRILCAGEPKVYEFLYALLDEVTELFPAPYFHLGGDEAPKSEWKQCEKCQALIQKEQLGSEEGLQAYFTKKLVDYLALKGKTAIGWNEILKSGYLAADTYELPEEAASSVTSPVCQYWAEMGKPYVLKDVAKGQRFIFSNNQCFYLDYPHAMVTLKAAYLCEPNVNWDFDIPSEQVLGVETPLWSERVPTDEALEKLVFPRLMAVAENGWSAERDFDEFLTRLAAYEAVLSEAGVCYTPWEEANVHGKEGVAQILQFMQGMNAMTDGSAGIEIPEDVKKELAESGMRFMSGFFRYSYTEEDKAYLTQLMGQQMEQL